MAYIATELMGLGVESFLATYLANNQGGGSASIEFVATFADLPASADDGTLGFTNDTKVLYIWDGTQWYQITKWKLTANTNFYVRTDGSDSNTGTANTAAGAWLTLQHAFDYLVQNVEQDGHLATVNIGAGTFVGWYDYHLGSSTSPSGRVTFAGAGVSSTTITDTTDGTCIGSYDNKRNVIRFQNVKFRVENGGYACCDLENNGSAGFVFSTIAWDIASGTEALFTFTCNVSMFGTQTIICNRGAGFECFVCLFHSTINFSANLDLTSATSGFTFAFLGVFDTAYVAWDVGTLTSTTTGPKVLCYRGGIIGLVSETIDRLPGSTGGEVDNVSFVGGEQGVLSGLITKTSAYSVLNTGTRYTYSNRGAGARVDFTLPSAVSTESIYQEFTFICDNANGIRVIANGTNTINLAGTISAAGGMLDSTQVGASVTLKCKASGEWYATSSLGTWTVT